MNGKNELALSTSLVVVFHCTLGGRVEVVINVYHISHDLQLNVTRQCEEIFFKEFNSRDKTYEPKCMGICIPFMKLTC